MIFFRALLLFGAGAIIGILSTFGGVVLGFDILHAKNSDQAFWYGVPACVIASGIVVFFASWHLQKQNQGLGIAFAFGFCFPVAWFLGKFFLTG
jgi:uncharacterized membrane protein (UPF0136 family)